MKFSNLFKSAAAISALALGFATNASAATANTTFNVTATVPSNCTISATGLSFGAYTGAQLDNTSTITVTCTNTTTYNVGLDAGKATGATVSTRSMKDQASAALLNYALYSDSSRTVNWGNTVGTDTKTGAGSGAAQAITVYGRIPANQFVTPNTTTGYQDTITATITY
jgi:spore coat protein U-like protein